MGCYEDERYIQELRRCGCRQCHREYEEFMYRSRRSYYDEGSKYINFNVEPPRLMTMRINMAKETPKVENNEPKNIAHKLLIDRFKIEQTKLNSAEANIKAQKAVIAIQNKSKAEAQKNLKELGAALKKLGHKEETNNA